MAKEILAVLETAYRATLEEQDDPTLWLLQSLSRSGAGISILLQGSAVSYLARDQDAAGLVFGSRSQTRPPRITESVADLLRRDVPVSYVAEDAAALGLGVNDLLDGVKAASTAEIPALVREHRFVWRF
jgi:hypothetical protein